MKNLVLITDFGPDSEYVGIMKGVAESIVPGLRIIDGCHSIQPQNIAHGALVIEALFAYWPEDTVFLAVVDPGVGSDRSILVAEVQGRILIAPDNGLLTRLLANVAGAEVRKLENSLWQLPQVSATFHGRDIMMPAAARLALGADISDAGQLTNALHPAPWQEPSVEEGKIRGRFLYADPFGNLVTNIPNSLVEGTFPKGRVQFSFADECIDGVQNHYSESTSGTFIAVENSLQRVEVSIVDGNAASKLRAWQELEVVAASSR